MGKKGKKEPPDDMDKATPPIGKCLVADCNNIREFLSNYCLDHRRPNEESLFTGTSSDD